MEEFEVGSGQSISGDHVSLSSIHGWLYGLPEGVLPFAGQVGGGALFAKLPPLCKETLWRKGERAWVTSPTGGGETE